MTSRKRRSGFQWICTALIFVFVIAPNAGRAQAAAPAVSPAALPPAAQEALNKGIIAAKVPDYLLAIRFFEEARKIAPEAPLIFLNLGIAESKMPGRELRAIAWFGAYLAATPDAPNAAAVKEQIAVLDVKNQSNLSRLIKTGQDAISRIPGWWGNRNNAYSVVARLWAEVGDISAALKAVELNKEELADKNSTWSSIAAAQARNGDIAGAQKTANLIQSAKNLFFAQEEISDAQITAGDIAGARKTLTSAIKTVDRLEVDRLESASVLIGAQEKIAKAQLRIGDSAGAQRMLASALKTADRLAEGPPLSGKSAQIRDVAELQIQAGDIVGAQKSAGLIRDAGDKARVHNEIAKAQAKSDAANASGSSPQPMLDAKSAIQPVVKSSDWLKKLDEKNQFGSLRSDVFLNLAGYLEGLPSDDPRKICNGLIDAAQEISNARQASTQALKQQFKQ